MGSSAQLRSFLLHSIAYSETSLIVELFSKELGRVSAIAKGAKRKGSTLRSVLMPFQPIEIALSGKSELKTLTQADWVGGMAMPVGDALICGFYLNELIIRLLAKEDPHPEIFDAYERCLMAITQELEASEKLDTSLRSFEWLLLKEVGYAPELLRDARGQAIELAMAYQWSATHGFVPMRPGVAEADSLNTVSGQTLLALAALTTQYQADSGENELDAARTLLSAPSTRMQAKRLTRAVLSHALDGQKLNSRQILIDLHRL